MGPLHAAGADTFGHFNSPTARGADSLAARFRSIVQAAQYAAYHLDEQADGAKMTWIEGLAGGFKYQTAKPSQILYIQSY